MVADIREVILGNAENRSRFESILDSVKVALPKTLGSSKAVLHFVEDVIVPRYLDMDCGSPTDKSSIAVDSLGKQIVRLPEPMQKIATELVLDSLWENSELEHLVDLLCDYACNDDSRESLWSLFSRGVCVNQGKEVCFPRYVTTP